VSGVLDMLNPQLIRWTTMSSDLCMAGLAATSSVAA